jgi:hypothetical protein
MRDLRLPIVLALLMTVPGMALSQQSPIDWGPFFDQVLSRDQTIQDQARERALGDILPRLCNERADLVSVEIPGLAEQLNQQRSEVRTQASAFLVTIAKLRADSATVLTSGVPALLKQMNDPVLQVKENSVEALASLHPEPPEEVVAALQDTILTGDDSVKAAAIAGVARVASSRPASEQLLLKLLSEGSPSAKQAVLRAIPNANLTNERVLRAVGASLSDRTGAVQNLALIALAKLGDQAVLVNRDAIAQLAERAGRETEIGKLAYQLLEER